MVAADESEMKPNPQSREDGQILKISELEQQLAEAWAQHDTRVGDIAALTESWQREMDLISEKLNREAEARERARLAVDKARANVVVLKRKLEEKESQLHLLRIKFIKVSKHRDAILASTSWKITAPLRWVTRSLRRR